jgi:hypothetical protein
MVDSQANHRGVVSIAGNLSILEFVSELKGAEEKCDADISPARLVRSDVALPSALDISSRLPLEPI